jgi:hypothetical protein
LSSRMFFPWLRLSFTNNLSNTDILGEEAGIIPALPSLTNSVPADHHSPLPA